MMHTRPHQGTVEAFDDHSRFIVTITTYNMSNSVVLHADKPSVFCISCRYCCIGPVSNTHNCMCMFSLFIHHPLHKCTIAG